MRLERRIPKVVLPRKFFSTIRSPEIRMTFIGLSIVPASIGSDFSLYWLLFCMVQKEVCKKFTLEISLLVSYKFTWVV